MIGLSGQRFMVSMCLKQGQLNIKINFLLFSWKLFSIRVFFPTSVDLAQIIFLHFTLNTCCFHLSWLAGQDLLQNTHSTEWRAASRSQTGGCLVGDSCKHAINRLWIVGSVSLNFSASLNNLHLINRKREGFWSSMEVMLLIPAVVQWCDRENVCAWLSIKNLLKTIFWRKLHLSN